MSSDWKSSLRRLDWLPFEHLVAELYAEAGWVVEVTSATRDGQKDVIARHPETGEVRYIEAKRWSQYQQSGQDYQQMTLHAKHLEKYFRRAEVDGVSFTFVTTIKRVGDSASKAINRFNRSHDERFTLLPWGKLTGTIANYRLSYLLDEVYPNHYSVDSVADLDQRLSAQGIDMKERILRAALAHENPHQWIHDVERQHRDISREPIHREDDGSEGIQAHL